MLSAMRLAAVAALLTVAESVAVRQTSSAYVNQTTCNGKTYTYESLAGFGSIPSNARDKYGDTIGGIGSSIALDQFSWKQLKNGSYTGILWTLPDRGWNTDGTLNFNPRVHKFSIVFTPNPAASVASPSPPNLLLNYLDTVLFSGPDGTPCTGLDADVTGSVQYPGFPALPIATYTGDGFGGAGPGGKRIPIDSEGLVLNLDGSFWVSDEYGPYIYHFSPTGRMIAAIQPPQAFIPHRNGSISFSADSPPRYNPAEVIIPANPDTGRANNQGFEGLTISADGRTLYALMQSATDQDGGLDSATRRYTRFVSYDIAIPFFPQYKSEYVVPLPIYTTAKGKPKVAAQSEIHFISPTQFFVLARDSGAGRGQSSTQSIYRHVDVFDISAASNVKGAAADVQTGRIATSAGVLNSTITPAQYCPFLDYNVNSQLNRFGVHNGGAQDASLLDEKWEGLALAPVTPGFSTTSGEVFVFTLTDNDFVTQDGHLKGGQFQYADSSGFNVDTQALVFKVKLPGQVY